MYGMNVEQKNTKSQLSNYRIYYQISITNSTVSSTSSCELPCENSQNIANRPTWICKVREERRRRIILKIQDPGGNLIFGSLSL
jgi:hypothetical protein